MNNKTLPSLNGWRAVSILLVLASHSTLIPGSPLSGVHFWNILFNGEIGVRFFFIISGFLITWLMLKEEREYNSSNLKLFYLRRTLRIWPVYLAYVFVLAILQFSGIALQHAYAWRGILTFTRNIYDPMWITVPSGPYLDWLSHHFWSLSIEEQFYLVWPFALHFIHSGKGRIGFIVMTILFSSIFKTLYLLGWYDPLAHSELFQDMNTFIYLDSLGWGCLGAMIFFSHATALKRILDEKAVFLFPVAVSMIVLPWIIGLGKGMQNLGFAILMLHSIVSPNWIIYRALNFKWMIRLGILSYSLYIWQQIICLMWPAGLLKVWFLWIPLAMGIAWLSYEFLEKPFLALRAKFRTPHQPLSGHLIQESTKTSS